MKTEILKGTKGINKGAKIIKNGGIVAFPTETVYGLGANAFDDDAVHKIFEAKGRPSDNPLIVHVARKKDILKVASDITPCAQKLADAFMPGPITLVLNKRVEIGDAVTAGLNTVGIRCPSNKIARKFIGKCKVPIAAPSANASTRISPTEASHVFEDMNGKIPLIIDGGSSDVGIESTVVSLVNDEAVILRPGYITSEQIAEVLGSCKDFQGQIINSAPAPGMKYKHYAPLVETVIGDGVTALEEIYKNNTDKEPVIICYEKTAEILRKNKDLNYNIISLGNSDKIVAKKIFSTMRYAEKKYRMIIIEYFKETKLAESVMNRILKSAGNKVF